MKVLERENDIKEKVLEGLNLSYKRLIQSKKERNLDLIISQNGEIVRIKPQEVECD
ncbi:MAG TPA: hypothetical protein VJY41_11920 [Prolixibacteraceae bacterium]|nr:hypothetical protein [Prolixibacteraceae bacterium]